MFHSTSEWKRLVPAACEWAQRWRAAHGHSVAVSQLHSFAAFSCVFMMAESGPVMEPSCLHRRSPLSLLDSKGTGATVTRMTPLTKTTRQQPTNKQATGSTPSPAHLGIKKILRRIYFSMSLSWSKNPRSSRSNPPLGAWPRFNSPPLSANFFTRSCRTASALSWTAMPSSHGTHAQL